MKHKKRSSLPSDEEEVGPSSKVLKMSVHPGKSSVKSKKRKRRYLNFEKLIRNDEIFDKLESMLDYNDLKSLRLVSKTCEDVVLKHKFIGKTRFTVSDDRTNPLQLQKMRFQPKHVKIRQFVCVYLEDSVAKKAKRKDCSMRKMHDILGFRILKGIGAGARPVYTIDEKKAVLKMCEDVETLVIVGPDYKRLKKFEHVYPPTRDLMAAPKSLQSLVIYGQILYEYKKDAREDAQATMAVNRLTLMGPCFSIIRHVQEFKNVSGITIQSPNFEWSGLKGTDVYRRKVQELIASNSSTLNRIYLDHGLFTFLNVVENTFPKLAYFKTSYKEEEAQSMNQFLLSHFAQLKELSLSFNGFPKQLLSFLDNAGSRKLLTLRLNYPNRNPPSEAWFNENSTSLNLRNFSSLQEFVLDFGTLGGVRLGIQDLPPSLRKVVIKPSHQNLNRLFPGESMDEVLKVLPNLYHWELQEYHLREHHPPGYYRRDDNDDRNHFLFRA